MNIRILRALTATVLLGSMSQTVHAGPFDSFEALGQDDFKVLVENLSAATHYRGVTPTEPLGLIGFDVGLDCDEHQ